MSNFYPPPLGSGVMFVLLWLLVACEASEKKGDSKSTEQACTTPTSEMAGICEKACSEGDAEA